MVHKHTVNVWLIDSGVWNGDPPVAERGDSPVGIRNIVIRRRVDGHTCGSAEPPFWVSHEHIVCGVAVQRIIRCANVKQDFEIGVKTLKLVGDCLDTRLCGSAGTLFKRDNFVI